VIYDRRRHAAARTDDYVFHQLIPYLGSKRRLLDVIAAAIAATGVTPPQAMFVDFFAGSGVVARFAKQLGFRVVANDWEPYARVLNQAAVACDREPPFDRLGGYDAALTALACLPPRTDWVTRHLCPRDDACPDPQRERLFWMRKNGRRIDALRCQIAAWQDAGTIDDAEACCLLAPLLYQACWTSNTSGVFKGFHAGWGGSNGTALHRITADLRLRPALFCNRGRRCEVTQLDAVALPASLGQRIDVAYLDPPYNQHPYASNYHALNSIVLWDKPALSPSVTGRGDKAAIRTDWRQTRRSAFNHRHSAPAGFERLLAAIDARWILVSYSTDGMIPLERLVGALAARGALQVFGRSYKRYRVSPTRPSPRPQTLEFVLACDTSQRCRRSGIDAVVEQLVSSCRSLA